MSIPHSGVGKLTLDATEKALAAGMVDLICFGRRLLVDPQLPSKLAIGRVKKALHCLECLHIMVLNQPVECRLTAFLGHEYELALTPAEVRKRVLVGGTGPGGIEAARISAERGDQVTLYDRSRELGGLMPIAAFIKGGAPDDLA